MTFIKECLNHKDLKGKLINCVSFGTIFFAFLFIAVIGYWSLYPYHPLEVNQRPFNIENKEMSKSNGDLLIYELDFCKNSKVRPLMKRRFSNELIYSLPEIEAHVKNLGCDVNRVALQIPHNLPAGEYIFIIEFTYEMNPIRDIVIKTHSVKFKILE